MRTDAEHPSRNAKPLRLNPLADWELRVGNLRVYYVVASSVETAPVVFVVAIGVKSRNEVLIGQEHFLI